jgi:hypothetical protein
MRYRIYAILHLIVMVSYICRPIIPYVQYAVFKDYIAKNLCVNKDNPNSCCNGKCYLEKEAKKANQTTDSDDRNTNRKVQNKELNEFLISHIALPEIFETNLLHLINFESGIPTRFVSAIFIPPRIESIL